MVLCIWLHVNLWSFVCQVETRRQTLRGTVVVTESDVVKPSVLLILLQMLLLFGITMTEPRTYRRHPLPDVLDRFGRPEQEYGTCELLDNKRKLWTMVMMVFHLGVVACTLREVFCARRIAARYSESHSTFVATLLIFQWNLFILPAFATEGPPAADAIRTVTLPVVRLVILLTFFWPKVILGINQRRSSRRSSSLNAIRSSLALISTPANFRDSGGASRAGDTTVGPDTAVFSSLPQDGL